MPAIAGSPWRALAKVVVDNAGLGERIFAVGVGIADETATGDQASWEGAPGTSLTLTYQTGTTGASPPGTPTTVTIEVRVPDGAQIGSTDWVNPVDGETKTFHFDNDPLNAAADAIRAGMFEIYIRAARTTVVTYDVDSRGTGADASDSWAQGYVRAPVTLAAYKTNKSALGDAEYTGTYASPDSTFNRVDLDAAWVRSGALTFRHLNGDSGATIRTKDNSATAAQRDYTFNAAATGTTGDGRINKDYPATTFSIRLILPATAFGGDAEYVWAAAGHAAGFTRDSDSQLTDEDRYTVDPRVTFTQLLLVDDNTFATPPSSEDVATGQRLASTLGFLAARATNARGEGFANSAIAWTEKLWDDNELVGSEASPVATRASTSATQGGELGWSDAFLTWDESLPSGGWTQKEIITTADLTGLELTATRALTLLAADPRIILSVGAGDPTAPTSHFAIGQQLTIGAALLSNGQKVTPDAGSVEFALLRFNPATGQLQYLDTSDATANTWTTLGASATPTFYDAATTPAVAASAGDAQISLLTFTTAMTGGSNWNTEDIFIIAKAMLNSVPYFRSVQVVVVGTANKHTGFAFDPTGLFK